MTRTITYIERDDSATITDAKEAIDNLDTSKYEGRVEWVSDGGILIEMSVDGVALTDFEDEIHSLDTFVNDLPVDIPDAADNAVTRGP